MRKYEIPKIDLDEELFTRRYSLPAHRVTFEFDFCLVYVGCCQHIV
jgi:hypothetical protein